MAADPSNIFLINIFRQIFKSSLELTYKYIIYFKHDKFEKTFLSAIKLLKTLNSCPIQICHLTFGTFFHTLNYNFKEIYFGETIAFESHFKLHIVYKYNIYIHNVYI